MKQKLTPRDYQLNPVREIVEKLQTQAMSRIVLAAAAGSGKTEMSIMIAEQFIKGGGGKVLVIAHHTNVIKQNFIDRLNQFAVDFTWSSTDTDVDLYVSIRSSGLNRIDFSQFNLIIVDEAHQNYFATTLQTLSSTIRHHLLLTATPSKFVKSNEDILEYDIVPLARLDIPNDNFANLKFRIVNADTGLVLTDYSSTDNVKSDHEFHINQVESIVESVIPYLTGDKKLFVCKDIKQATMTSQILTDRGFPTLVSDSRCDSDSTIVEAFKSGQINSLCVVDRMRVGYSDNSLYQTIDMCFTHNPDTILQMLSRSNRGNLSQNKDYIKVTNRELNVRTRYMLSIAIALFRKDNILSFNGTASTVKVPLKKGMKKKSARNSTSQSNWFIPDSVNFVDFFSNCDFVDSSQILRELSSNRLSYDVVIKRSEPYSNCRDFRKEHGWCVTWLIENDLFDEFLREKKWSYRLRNKPDKYKNSSDEELLLLKSEYTSARELQVNYQLYKEMKDRGLDTTFNGFVKWSEFSDEEILKKASEYRTVRELQKTNRGLYKAYIRVKKNKKV